MDRKIINHIILFLSVATFIAGCKEDEAVPVISPEDNLYFNYERQTIVVDVNVDDDFSVYSPTDDFWCTCSKASGNKLVVTVAQNTLQESRTSYIMITSSHQTQKINVIQDQSRYFRLLSASTLRVSSTQSSRKIMIDTNISDASCEVHIPEQDKQWLSMEVSGMEITMTVTQNPGAERTSIALITCTAPVSKERFEITMTITQATDGGVNYHFAIPAFTESKVYKVMDGNKQIAQICKEYLLMDGIVDVQAVVVYPVSNENATVYLADGFIAQVLLRSENGGRHTVPTGNVHGGSVSFSKESNSITSYVQGDLQHPISTIYMPSGADMTGEKIEGSIPADVVPDVIHDVRGTEDNVYPIVKIGAQYWMGKNLNTTFYNANKSHAAIPTNFASNSQEWKNGEAGCSVYNYNNALAPEAAATRDKLGVLYTYLAINGANTVTESNIYEGGSKELLDNLSPEEWIVPRLEDWDKLLTYIGTTAKMRRLREFLTDRGAVNNISGEPDEGITGFAARNGSFRNISGSYPALGSSIGAYFWSRTLDDNPAQAWNINLINKYQQSIQQSYSIRCIKTAR